MHGQKAVSNRQLIAEFWQFLRPDNAKSRRWFYVKLALLTLSMLLALAFDLARPFLLKGALDNISAKNSAGLMQMVVAFLFALIGEYLCKSGYSFFLTMGFLKTVFAIRQKVFEHVLHLKMAFFDHEPVGRLLTRTINDCESLKETLNVGVSTIVVDLLTIVGVLVVMFHLDLALAPVVLISAPLVICIVRWFGAKLRQQFLIVRQSIARANGFMSEAVHGVEIIQLFNRQDLYDQKFQELNRDYRQATIWNNAYDASLYAVIDSIGYLVTGFILYVGLGLRFGITEISAMIVYINLVERIFVPIRDLSGKFATIQQALAALERIFSLLHTPEHIPQGDKVINGKQLAITFSNVGFRYQEQAPIVLEAVSFSVAPGQVTALIGATGSGKSTIGRLLTRAYDGYTGHITVGGVELREANYHHLRSHIAVVHQDVIVFPGSLRDNITMFNPQIAPDKIDWAIAVVKAKAMLAQLPGGLDCPIRENGSNLSAGQLQLIAFTRALVNDAPIILMDEATSSVDSVSEAWIQQALQEIFRVKTVIVIAHRLATITAADTILVLKDGRIVERGNHAELSEQPQSYYAQLLRSSKIK